MSIGGAKLLDAVTRESLAKMAEEVGMRPQLVLGRLDAMAKRIVPAAQRLAFEMNASWPSYDAFTAYHKDGSLTPMLTIFAQNERVRLTDILNALH